MRVRTGSEVGARRYRCCDVMRDELSHALVEGLYELDVLPTEEEGALLGLYALMEDLREAMTRAEAMDLAQSA
jgi:hypothetical protein